MDFYEYWKLLVVRVFHEQEVLVGVEDIFYRLSCIYGETMVDGIQSYFERRVDEYKKDRTVLREHGFGNIADEFEVAKLIMFGEGELTPEGVEQVFDQYYQDEKLEDRIDQQLGPTYDRLIEQLDVLNWMSLTTTSINWESDTGYLQSNI